MRKQRFMAAILASFLSLPLAAQAQDFDFNFQSCYQGPHVLNHQVMIPWIEQMNEVAKGEVAFHFFQSTAIVKEPEGVAAVMNGTLDMGSLSVIYTDHLFPHALAAGLPFIGKNSRHVSELYWRMYNTLPEVKKEMDAVGQVCTIWGSDRSGIFSPKEVIKSPSDLRGKRVLIWSGALSDLVTAWGGIPVQVTPADTYMGLQRGMGDVFLGPLPTGVASRLMEVSKEITVLPAYSSLIFNVINRDTWEDLPEHVQQAIRETVITHESSQLFGQTLYDATNRDIETMKAEGCNIHFLTPDEVQTWKAASHQVSMDFWEKDLARLGVADPKGWIEMLYALSDQVAAEMGIE